MGRAPRLLDVDHVVAGPLDPLAVLPGLLDAVAGHDHVVYEHDDTWTIGFGARAEILIDAEGARLLSADGGCHRARSSAPHRQVEELLDALDVDRWTALGWVSPDLGSDRTDRSDPTLHLIVPRTLVALTRAGATVRSEDPDDVERVTRALATAPVAPVAPAPAPAAPVALDREAGGAQYREAVTAALEAIDAGRLDKVVLSRAVPVATALDFPATYVAGRRVNAPARSVLLSMRGVELLGFCPETVVCVDTDGAVTSEPVAGTRACPPDPAAAQALARELSRDPKEVFEHTIAVRAMLESFRGVCDPDGLAVDDLLSVRRRGSVQHLASSLRGRLAPGRTAWDAFDAAFPAVTATGVPREAARTLIGELESSPRGLYAGAVVRVEADGTFDSALILRAVHRRGGRTWLQAGGGIVAGADPGRELEETDEKLRSIACALRAARHEK